MRQNYNVIKIVTVSVIIFIVLLFSAMIINLVRLGKVRAQEKELEAKIEAAAQEIVSNGEEIDLKSSLEYIERIARERLNMKRSGEDVVVGK